VFKYNAPNGISSLDPAFARNQDNIWACGLLFNGLVQTDSLLNPVPAIAKSWEIADSGRSYIFHLRRDVHFHDHEVFKNGQGRKVIASDFAYSFNRILDPETASPGAWIFNGKMAENGFEALNDSTLVIHLIRSFPPFIGMLTMPYCFVVPMEAIAVYGKDFGTHPIGTGPFIYKEWYDGVKLILHKNPHYFEKQKGQSLPFIDAVSISFIESRQTEFLEFIQGNLDMFGGLESSFKDEFLTRSGTIQTKYRDKIQLILSPYLNTEYLAFNLDNTSSGGQGSVRDIHFRRAINYAIDRPAMMNYLRNNIGIPALQGFVPAGLSAFDATKNGFKHDPERARIELSKSDYRPTEKLILHTTRDYLDLCLFIQKQLLEIGIVCSVEVMPSSLMKTEKSAGRLAFFRGSWIADYPDAENYLSCFTSENKAPNGPNYTRYQNSTYDQLYEQSLIQTDDSLRVNLYRQMDGLIIEAAAIVPLFYDQSVRLYQKNVSGIYADALNSLNLKFVRKD
jgi:peptide/nickel transport system substrate-binding protein